MWTHTKKKKRIIINKVNAYYKQCSAVNINYHRNHLCTYIVLASTFVQTIICIMKKYYETATKYYETICLALNIIDKIIIITNNFFSNFLSN